MSDLCSSHLEALARELADRGFNHITAVKNVELPCTVSRTELRRVRRRSSYNPIMSAYIALLLNAAGTVEMLLESCPICYLINNCSCKRESCKYRSWIKLAANYELERAKKFGLIGDA